MHKIFSFLEQIPNEELKKMYIEIMDFRAMGEIKPSSLTVTLLLKEKEKYKNLHLDIDFFIKNILFEIARRWSSFQ